MEGQSMNLYTNGFRLAAKEGVKEVVINFIQSSPVIGDNNEISSISYETVASLVMLPETARTLSDSINELLDAGKNDK